MDVEELSGFRLHSGWHRSSSAMNSSGREDDTWEYFPCPFCYVEVNVPSLASHLQEEHCFDMNNTVCPMCAVNPGNDMIEHFTVQHSQLLKRRKSLKTSLLTNNLAFVEKEPYDVCSFLQVASANCQSKIAPDLTPDPLLSSFICSIASPNMNSSEENSETHVASTFLQGQSLEPSISNEVLEQDYEERIQRAEFVQQVLMSTIF